MVVEEDSRNFEQGVKFTVSLECLADGFPMPTYKITHQFTNGSSVYVSHEFDKRYTVTGGRQVPINFTRLKERRANLIVLENLLQNKIFVRNTVPQLDSELYAKCVQAKTLTATVAPAIFMKSKHVM